MLRVAKRDKSGKVTKVEGLKSVPPFIKKLRIPPAWETVSVADTQSDKVWAQGVDIAGRRQALYSPDHTATAKDRKFRKIRKLLLENEEIRSQIELDIKKREKRPKWREAAICLYLIYETGIRPGSNAETKGSVKAYGATTLMLKHIKLSTASGRVRLQFVGKKGVKQNILVTNPWLVEELVRRKEKTTAWSTPVFDCSSSLLNQYSNKFGYSAKDFRTMRGTMVATDLLTNRRIPKRKTRAKRVLNKVLDEVAKKLGNTRAIAKSSYVDPIVLEPWNNAIKG